MKETLAFHIMALYRDFLAYTTKELKEQGLSFGQMPLILYTGKHPGCTQAELKQRLNLDWGYSQRSVAKLASAGFIEKKYDEQKSGNCLTLTEKGEAVFFKSHEVFASWDQSKTGNLTAEEKENLLYLLTKLTITRKES